MAGVAQLEEQRTRNAQVSGSNPLVPTRLKEKWEKAWTDMVNKIASLIDKFKKHDKDTGSVELQIISLTEEINKLHEHCKKNPKDYSSQRGLLQKVNQRKRFLLYMKKNDENIYKGLIKELGLRR